MARSARACWAAAQMHCQMFRVDCSCDGSVSSCSHKVDKPYVVLLLWLPEPNVLGCQADNVAVVIDDAGASAAGADVDADVVA